MKPTPQANPARDKFHERIHASHMYGLWELASQMTPHPEPKARTATPTSAATTSTPA